LDPIGQRGQSPLGALLSPFEVGRARLFAHVVLASLLLVLESVAARSPHFRLDLASLVIVYIALEYTLLQGAFATLIVGYLADLISGESRGLSMAGLVIVFLLVRLLVVRITGSRWFMVTSVSVFSTIAALLLRLLIEAIVGPASATLRSITPAIPSLVVGSAVLAVPCYRLFRLVDDRFRPRDDSFTVYPSYVPRKR
jgi:rod shape-determining protein MreD